MIAEKPGAQRRRVFRFPKNILYKLCPKGVFLWNIIHCPIGKVSFGTEKLAENFKTLMDAIVKAKPAAAKGQYVRSCVVSATMGPGVKINPSKFI